MRHLAVARTIAVAIVVLAVGAVAATIAPASTGAGEAPASTGAGEAPASTGAGEAPASTGAGEGGVSDTGGPALPAGTIAPAPPPAAPAPTADQPAPTADQPAAAPVQQLWPPVVPLSEVEPAPQATPTGASEPATGQAPTRSDSIQSEAQAPSSTEGTPAPSPVTQPTSSSGAVAQPRSSYRRSSSGSAAQTDPEPVPGQGEDLPADVQQTVRERLDGLPPQVILDVLDFLATQPQLSQAELIEFLDDLREQSPCLAGAAAPAATKISPGFLPCLEDAFPTMVGGVSGPGVGGGPDPGDVFTLPISRGEGGSPLRQTVAGGRNVLLRQLAARVSTRDRTAGSTRDRTAGREDASDQPLPFTGTNVVGIAFLGLALLAAGLMLVRLVPRRV